MKKKMNGVPRPVLKWAGGKSSLLVEFEQRNLLPRTFNDYHEPFFGGGAVYYHLWKNNLITKAHLSDINDDIINLYLIIKNNVQELITELSRDQYQNDKEIFYELRNKYNEMKKNPISDSDQSTQLKRAALIVYLNKTCFNGLYRENKSGDFNVPFGRYKRPTIIDKDNLIAVEKSFAKATIQCLDYKNALENAKPGDFVYLDPPYMPLSETSNFSDYHKNGFGIKEQRELSDSFRILTERGVLALLSNSNHPEIIKLYRDIDGIEINEVKAPRFINCKGEGRKAITELAITNFKPEPINRKLSSYS